ncbi:MAG: DVUA0089 family protein [Betaproteobacteria bacterium]|nr:DVUA0089 family protein [Betaproteobacteria bacterium]
MKQTLFSAVLASGLFFGAVAAQADTLKFDYDSTLFQFKDVSFVFYESFVVDHSLSDYQSDGVKIWTDFFAKSPSNSFYPVLVVWDSSGNQVGDYAFAGFDDVSIDFGFTLAEGTYRFALANYPNVPAGNAFDDGFDFIAPVTPGFLSPTNGNGTSWNVYVSGVSAIPEPETWAMLLVGLGVMGSVARRRKLQ